jgi:hypothetical protein
MTGVTLPPPAPRISSRFQGNRALCLLGAAALLAACSRGQSAPRPKEDPALVAYRAQIAPFAPAEQAALDAIAAHTGDKYTTDGALLAALRDTALPRYREYVAGLAKVAPQEAKLRAFHEQLRALADRELAALERLERAVARGDGTSVLLVNQEHRRLREERTRLLTAPPGDLATAGVAGTP